MANDAKFNEWKANLRGKTLNELESELDYCQEPSTGQPRMGLVAYCSELEREIRERKR